MIFNSFFWKFMLTKILQVMFVLVLGRASSSLEKIGKVQCSSSVGFAKSPLELDHLRLVLEILNWSVLRCPPSTKVFKIQLLTMKKIGVWMIENQIIGSLQKYLSSIIGRKTPLIVIAYLLELYRNELELAPARSLCARKFEARSILGQYMLELAHYSIKKYSTHH